MLHRQLTFVDAIRVAEIDTGASEMINNESSKNRFSCPGICF